jgi:hypothetical protein
MIDTHAPYINCSSSLALNMNREETVIKWMAMKGQKQTIAMLPLMYERHMYR